MAILRVQHILQRKSGVPEDQVVNTFHFYMGGPTIGEPQYTEINNRISQFYNVAPATGQALCDYLSPAISPQGARIRIYDLDDPQPRQPVSEFTYNLNGVGSTPLPAECAACLSWKAQPTSGVRPERQRNRIYFGPLAQNTMTVTDDVARLAPAFMAALVDSGQRLAGNQQFEAPEPRLTVASQFTDDAVAIWQMWVDNDFDTQRRRSPRATTRVVRQIA